jgi:hypothetical protein
MAVLNQALLQSKNFQIVLLTMSKSYLCAQNGTQIVVKINPFQSNFSATRILPCSYLFWAGKRLVDYLSVVHEEKRRDRLRQRSERTNTTKKTCRTSSDIGAEQENHNVGRGPTLDRKGLNILDRTFCEHVCKSYAVDSMFLGAVCGLKWLEHFIYLLFPHVSQLIYVQISSMIFNFDVLQEREVYGIFSKRTLQF